MFDHLCSMPRSHMGESLNVQNSNPKHDCNDPSLLSYARCLSLEHLAKSGWCDIRCKSCFRYGQTMQSCLNRKLAPYIYRPKQPEGPHSQHPEVSREKEINAQSPPTNHCSASSSPPRQPKKHQLSSSSPPVAMANFAIDSRPHARRGFEVIPHDQSTLSFMCLHMDNVVRDLCLAINFYRCDNSEPSEQNFATLLIFY
ncbi:hypothetical protein SEVIR_2G131332v4 [Setaria viridis]